MDFEDLWDTGVFHIIGNLLSLLTIGLCCVSKIPQIMTLVKMESAKGISLNGLTLELFSYSTTMLYNFTNAYALLTYLEYPILLIQEYALIYFVLKYEKLMESKNVKYTVIAYLVFVSGFGIGLLPKSILVFLIPLTTPVGAISKILQLLQIIKTKDSESVSLITWGLSAFTNLTRIYTIMIDSQDKMLLANFGVSTVLSLSVFLAAIFYKNKTKKV